MKRIFASILLSCVVMGSTSYAQDDRFNWINSYKEGLRQARETGKPMLLSFRCVP